MKKLYKTFKIKSDDSGKISGYFATYDRIPDSYGDVIAKGAFTETIQNRKESGHPFPLCWGHDLNQIIGAVDPEDIEETEKGPLMTASFFKSPLAQEKREIVKSGVVYQFSFAYDILDSGEVTLEDGTKANELRKLDLFEVSIVPIPANPRAEVTDIKATVAEAVVKIVPELDEEAMKDVLKKAGRRNSKKDAEAIRQAITLLQGVLDNEEEDEPEDNGAPEDQKGSNSELNRSIEILRRNKL